MVEGGGAKEDMVEGRGAKEDMEDNIILLDL